MGCDEFGKIAARPDRPLIHMTRELTIDHHRIADDTDCYVIAEIGHNHQGDLEKARQLFHRAKECGVHAVKLQKRDNRSLYTADIYRRPHDNENSFGSTHGNIGSFSSSGAKSMWSSSAPPASSG